MKINEQIVNGEKFAYDGCHKIYVIEDKEDLEDALNLGYGILDIDLIEEFYNSSCDLKFISNWKLDKQYVRQFENAKFEN